MQVRHGWLLLAGAAVLLAAASPIAADEKGEAVLRDAFKTLHDAKTFSADFNASMSIAGAPGPVTFKGTVLAMKPNLLRVEMKGPSTLVFAADGKNYFAYNSQPNTYSKTALEAAPTEFLGMWEGEIDAFFGGEKNLPKVTVTYVGTEKIDGVECDQVKAEPKERGATAVYSISKADHYIRKAVLTLPGPGGQPVTQTNTLTNIKLNVSKKEGDFKYTPPKDAKPAGAREA
jgi:outer membrane lipoprotein-sorting protein